MEHGVKYRDMWTQVGLMIITIGFYGIYWFYQTAMELKFLNKDPNANPALWTVLLFIPFGGIYSWYKYASLYELESRDHLNRWILFLLWMVFCPAVWFIVQTELNRRATWNFPSPRG
jgi:cbb3-type cytochrome oxidase subunit 3